MTSRTHLPETGTLVTARILDATGVEHSFHGTLCGTGQRLTHVREFGGVPQYTRFADEEALRPELGEPETYARIYSATGNPMPQGGLARSGADWWFTHVEIYVRLDSANVTLTEATEAGREWVAANQSLDNRRAALLAQVTALDPTLGAAVDRLCQDLDDAAYERGRNAEWQANNF